MKNLVQCNVPGFCNLYVTKEGKAFKIQSNNTQKQTDDRARVYSDRLRLRVYSYKLRHPNTTSRYLAQKFKISKTKARSIVTGKDYIIKKAYFL